MKWAHLPAAGGLYDQHPDLLDQFEVIFEERAKYQERKRKEDERKNRGKTPRPVAGGRRR